MRAHEILGYVDLDRISDELLRHLTGVIDREMKRPADLAVIGLIYGQTAFEIKIEQAKAELERTKAEIERLMAAADKDRVEAGRDQKG